MKSLSILFGALLILFTSCSIRDGKEAVVMQPSASSDKSASNSAESTLAETNESEPLDVSIVQLIATPEKFNGRTVGVVGVVRLEFEGNSISLHREDYQNHIFKNSLWLDVPPAIMKRRTELDGKYCSVVGVFYGYKKGHMGLFSGTIEDIKTIGSIE